MLHPEINFQKDYVGRFSPFFFFLTQFKFFTAELHGTCIKFFTKMILHTNVRKFLTFSFPEFIIRHSTLIWLMVAVSVLTDNCFSWHSIDLHSSCWISIDQLQTEVQPNHRTNPIIVIAIERIWTFPGYQNVAKALIVVSALQIVRIIYTLIDEFHLGGEKIDFLVGKRSANGGQLSDFSNYSSSAASYLCRLYGSVITPPHFLVCSRHNYYCRRRVVM